MTETRAAILTAAIVAMAWIGPATHALGQPAGCTLVTDARNPKDKILRCGEGLTIHAAADTKFQLTGGTAQAPPTGASLRSGALLIEFTPSDRARNFQILTPHAIAAVRGTRWAVEVIPARSATLVLEGAVDVSHRRGRPHAAVLGPGEGADVTATRGPIVVKRWAQKRVDALLARFGQ
jgi:ferric-dicitrate binding protein FerR (iron transport regulator)